MKAVVVTKYGPPDVLQLRELPKPEPGEGQALVKVRAASVNALDYRRFEMSAPYGRLIDALLFKSPGKVLGADIAGTVEAMGAGVRSLQPGDEVFGISAGSEGGFAEYACAAAAELVRKPEDVSFEAAGATPVAGLTALQGLRDHARIQVGQKVLIYGASGGVGTFAVQIAKSFGTEVTAVCSTRNVEMVQSIGADRVTDYTKERFNAEGRRFDLIFAVNGYQGILAYRGALNPHGIYMMAGGSMPQIIQGMLIGPLLSRFGERKMGFMGLPKSNPEDLLTLAKLLETGKVKPVVERTYALEETAEAIRYVVEEHARGKIVVTMG